MDRPEYPEDEQPGTTNNVPSLIHDYRAQRDAWREQARNLARMREEVLAAADREARDIVSGARTDVRQILLKARRDLLVLAAQVRAAGRLGDSEETPDTVTFLPADDLGHAQKVLTSARHDVRRVLDESRPELEGLSSEGEALRAALRQQQRPAAVHPLAPPVRQTLADSFSQAPVDFQFTSIAADEPAVSDSRRLRVLRPIRKVVAAAAMVGAVLLMGTAWLFTRTEPADSPAPVAAGAPKQATPRPSAPAGTPASTAAPASALATTNARSPLSINVAAKRLAWIRVTVDGRVTAERLFKPGETQQINATREVSIRAGDAGAVFVSVGGGQSAALGREGEVVTRRFGAPTRTASEPQAPVARPITPAAPVAARSVERPSVASTAPSSPRVTPSVPPPAPQQRSPEPQTLARADTARVVTPAQPTPTPVLAPALPNPAANAGTKPTTTPVERPAASSAPAVGAKPPSLQDSLTSAATRWLDAYYRQDRAAMAAISGTPASVSDDRKDNERLPRGLGGVRRSLDDVNFQLFGSEAMMTARMTERMEDASAAKMAQTVSFVSHFWTQKNGVWQLYDVRIVSASALSRAVR